jgi:hypothetical protein
MKKVVIILLLSALWFKVQAANFDKNPLPVLLQPYLSVWDNNNLPEKYIIEWPAAVNLKKFTYAELVWQRTPVERIWVSGKSVSQEVKNAVAISKYRDEALEVMGDDGWELVSTVIRNIDYGFEIMFYFKKSIN